MQEPEPSLWHTFQTSLIKHDIHMGVLKQQKEILSVLFYTDFK